MPKKFDHFPSTKETDRLGYPKKYRQFDGKRYRLYGVIATGNPKADAQHAVNVLRRDSGCSARMVKTYGKWFVYVRGCPFGDKNVRGE